MTQFNFNVEVKDPSQYDVIPAGWYPAVIQKIEDKANSQNTGRLLNVTWAITGGQAAGRLVFDNINYDHPNDTAERIGRETLGKIAGATGLQSLTNSQQLLNCSCMIQLIVKPDPQYGDRNNIKAYKALELMQAPVAAFQPPVQQGTIPQVQYQAPPAVQYQAPPQPVAQPVVEPWNQPQQQQQVAPQAAPPAWLPPQV